MIDTPLMTSEQFAEQQYELGDGGRWIELVAGKVVNFQPPDEVHGNVVLNLSKSLANYFQTSDEGYVCFELGLVVRRNPDTVRRPAMCCFTAGQRFAEADKDITETRPSMIVEVASTNDRRRGIKSRVQAYLDWGVELVWVIDTSSSVVYVFQPCVPTVTLRENVLLIGKPVLSSYTIPVVDLFAEPKWWHSK